MADILKAVFSRMTKEQLLEAREELLRAKKDVVLTVCDGCGTNLKWDPSLPSQKCGRCAK